MNKGVGTRWAEFSRLAGGQAAASALSAAWLIIAARRLGIETFGNLSLALALAAILGVLGDLGMSLFLTRVGAESTPVDQRLFRSTVVLKTTATIPATGVLISLYETSAQQPDVAVPAILGISLLATAVYSSFTAVLRGRGDVTLEAKNEAFSRLGVLGLGTLWLSYGGGLLAAVCVYAAADVTSAVVVPAVARRRIPWSYEVGRRAPLRELLPLTLATTSGIIYNRIDVWLLALLSSARQVGLYGVSTKLLDGVLLPARAISALALRFTASNESQFAQRYQPERGAALSLALRAIGVTMPVAGALALLARPLVDLVFGSTFQGAVPLIQLLMAAAVPGAVVLALSPVVAASRTRAFVPLVALSIAVNVVANAILIPFLQAKGAVVATLIGELGLAIGLLIAAEGRHRARGAVN